MEYKCREKDTIFDLTGSIFNNTALYFVYLNGKNENIKLKRNLKKYITNTKKFQKILLYPKMNCNKQVDTNRIRIRICNDLKSRIRIQILIHNDLAGRIRILNLIT